MRRLPSSKLPTNAGLWLQVAQAGAERIAKRLNPLETRTQIKWVLAKSTSACVSSPGGGDDRAARE
jgi:hypothetical protein